MLDHLLEKYDLTSGLTVLGLLGILTCVYVMQLTRYEAEDHDDPPWLRFFRRLALGLLAWALCWLLTYSENKNWQPWPPLLLAVAAMDMILIIRALAIRARIRRTGHTWGTDVYRAVASTRAKQAARN